MQVYLSRSILSTLAPCVSFSLSALYSDSVHMYVLSLEGSGLPCNLLATTAKRRGLFSRILTNDSAVKYGRVYSVPKVFLGLVIRGLVIRPFVG